MDQLESPTVNIHFVVYKHILLICSYIWTGFSSHLLHFKCATLLCPSLTTWLNLFKTQPCSHMLLSKYQRDRILIKTFLTTGPAKCSAFCPALYLDTYYHMQHITIKHVKERKNDKKRHKPFPHQRLQAAGWESECKQRDLDFYIYYIISCICILITHHQSLSVFACPKWGLGKIRDTYSICSTAPAFGINQSFFIQCLCYWSHRSTWNFVPRTRPSPKQSIFFSGLTCLKVIRTNADFGDLPNRHCFQRLISHLHFNPLNYLNYYVCQCGKRQVFICVPVPRAFIWAY